MSFFITHKLSYDSDFVELPKDLQKQTTATEAEEIAEHEASERRLLFVGCTRAMRRLFLTHDGSLPSPFLKDLSDERWLRVGAG